MNWISDSHVQQLIKYMTNKGCEVLTPNAISRDELIFLYEGESIAVSGVDIFNALHAAYRIEWEPHKINKRFERYLIDLHEKRRALSQNERNFHDENGI